MPSVRYVNQTAPFWDFVAGLENQGAEHPFFARGRDANNANTSSDDEAGTGPWAGAGQWGWGFPPRPPHHHGWHRGRGHAGEGPSRGPPGPPPPPADDEKMGGDSEGEKDGEEPPSYDGPGEAGPGAGGPGHRRRGGPHHGPWGRCGGRGGRGGHGHGHGRGGRWAHAGPWNMGPLADFFQSQMFGGGSDEQGEDFKPDVDVFDTESAFVVHASLPGAKREDCAVSYDADKSELSITGVTFRPGDEEFLKTLAMDERKVGAFERKVRLGSRASPAQVDIEGITAKLEEGILRVTVPKLDKEGYVEVKKIDIE